MGKHIKKAWAVAVVLGLVVLLLGYRKPLASIKPAKAYQENKNKIIETSHYYATKPEGKALGGVLIYPDDKEDPAVYCLLAQRLAQAGWEARVVKYPFGFAGLAKQDGSETLNGDHYDHWMVLGFGQGAKPAWAVADRASYVIGLISMGNVVSDVNLNDNDVRVQLVDFEQEAMSEDKLNQALNKLPRDASHLRMASKVQVLEGEEGADVDRIVDMVRQIHLERSTAESKR